MEVILISNERGDKYADNDTQTTQDLVRNYLFVYFFFSTISSQYLTQKEFFKAV